MSIHVRIFHTHNGDIASRFVLSISHVKTPLSYLRDYYMLAAFAFFLKKSFMVAQSVVCNHKFCSNTTNMDLNVTLYAIKSYPRHEVPTISTIYSSSIITLCRKLTVIYGFCWRFLKVIRSRWHESTAIKTTWFSQTQNIRRHVPVNNHLCPFNHIVSGYFVPRTICLLNIS